jgi:hypothetical protein
MANRSKQKGDRREREVVEALRTLSPLIQAQRVPLSGAAGGKFSGDVRIEAGGQFFTAEVKARRDGDGWKKLAGWLADHDLLFLIADRKAPLVAMPWGMFAWLMREALCP